MKPTDDPNADSDGDGQIRSLQGEQQDILAETAELVSAVNGIRSVDTLDEPVREESIEEARNILRWLRNMQFTEQTVEECLDQGTPVVVNSKKQSMQRLVIVFAMLLRKTLKSQQDRLRTDLALQNAANAAAALALELAEHTRQLLADNDRRLATLDALIDSLPEEAELRSQQSVLQLIETIELGLDRMTGKQVSPLSAAERLAKMQQRMYMDMQALQATDQMQPPAREESLELARDILRRMQNQSYGKQTVEQFVKTAPVEDKAAFAQQLSEMAGTYRNLLSEAVIFNPNIHQDARIREAADALNVFMHAISLMAAKEMPNSLASTQQISADATRDPEQWQKLCHHTVDRLVKCAEGGVEKALEDIAQQQEQQEQERDEEMQEAAESASLQNDHGKRKKKRRRGGTQRTGKGGKKQRKQMLDLTADDYMLKQGRFHEQANVVRAAATPPGMAGLDATALASIRALGQQLTMGAAQNVSVNDKIMPDNKTAAEQAIEREKQRRNNPAPRV